jgi:UDP-N-acetylglucosamine 2-epimerase
MKVLSIVGARPQFIKAMPVSLALAPVAEEVLVHTGQHYDYLMSQAHFESLQLPTPSHNLGVGSGTHGEQTARVILGVEATLRAERPDVVLVYGDTNSTLGAALAAAKLGFALAHVEAGPRTWQRSSVEEINRVVTDHLCDLLFCPTELSVANLRREGLECRSFMTGDVMYDTLRLMEPSFRQPSPTLRTLGLEQGGYVVLTAHRAEHVDSRLGLEVLVSVAAAIEMPVVFPIHPRTEAHLREAGLLDRLSALDGLCVTAPLDYVEMMRVCRGAVAVVTDSGGLQKEAYLLGVPCLTLASATGWPETLAGGWNTVVGFDAAKVRAALRQTPTGDRAPVFGDGRAAERIADILAQAVAKGLPTSRGPCP